MKPKFTPTAGMISMAETVFKAMAFVETIKPVVQKNKATVLAKNNFRSGGKLVDKLLARGIKVKEIIKEERDTHYMIEEDFTEYLKQVFDLNTKAGLASESYEYCPLLVAENLLNRAENELLDIMKPITKFGADEACHSLEIRAKAIDLTLRLLAPFVKNAKK